MVIHVFVNNIFVNHYLSTTRPMSVLSILFDSGNPVNVMCLNVGINTMSIAF